MRRNTYCYHRLLKDGLLEIVVYDETAINEHVPPGQFELNKNPKSYMPSYAAIMGRGDGACTCPRSL